MSSSLHKKVARLRSAGAPLGFLSDVHILVALGENKKLHQRTCAAATAKVRNGPRADPELVELAALDVAAQLQARPCTRCCALRDIGFERSAAVAELATTLSMVEQTQQQLRKKMLAAAVMERAVPEMVRVFSDSLATSPLLTDADRAWTAATLTALDESLDAELVLYPGSSRAERLASLLTGVAEFARRDTDHVSRTWVAPLAVAAAVRAGTTASAEDTLKKWLYHHAVVPVPMVAPAVLTTVTHGNDAEWDLLAFTAQTSLTTPRSCDDVGALALAVLVLSSPATVVAQTADGRHGGLAVPRWLATVVVDTCTAVLSSSPRGVDEVELLSAGPLSPDDLEWETDATSPRPRLKPLLSNVWLSVWNPPVVKTGTPESVMTLHPKDAWEAARGILAIS